MSPRLALSLTKVCTACGEEKPRASGFYTSGTKTMSKCRRCHNRDTYERRKGSDAERERQRAYAAARHERHTAERYGMTVDELRALPAACEVCGSSARLAHDHDHATGEYRGRLCGACNLTLGHAGDDPARLRALADYLDSR